MRKSTLITDCRGVHGEELSEEDRRALRAVLLRPCVESWEAACCIVIGGDTHMTLWGAVTGSTPSFLKSIPEFCEMTKKRIWKQIPDQISIARAFRHAAEAHKATISDTIWLQF